MRTGYVFKLDVQIDLKDEQAADLIPQKKTCLISATAMNEAYKLSSKTHNDVL